MDTPGGVPTGRLPRALRELERRLGADRGGRTLWIWVIPAATVAISFAVLAFLGVQGRVDLGLTIPMALTLSLFLGSMSAIYLTAASSDERDDDDGDGPDHRGGPADPAPPSPGDGEVAPPTVIVPVPPQRPAERAQPLAPTEPAAR